MLIVRIVAEMLCRRTNAAKLYVQIAACELLMSRSTDRLAEPSRVRPVPTLNSLSDAVFKTARRPIDRSQDLGSPFEDQNGITSAEPGRDLAKLIVTAFRAVQVGHVYRDLVHLRLISIQCEHNDSFHRFSQFISKIDSTHTKIDCRR
jgi:hypothetical protein